MPKPGHFILALLFGVSACATQAQRQHQANETSIQVAVADAVLCIRAIYESSDSDPLRDDMPFRVDQATIQQLTNGSFVSDTQIAAIFAIHPRLQECRTRALNELATTMPSVSVIVAQEFMRLDSNLVQLIQREISWGEYLRRSQSDVADSTARADAEYRRIEAGLERSHEAEVARRQAVARAFGAWAQQQQVLNDMNSTRVTHCWATGITVRCTTR